MTRGSTAGLLTRRTQSCRSLLGELGEMMADSPMLSRSGGMRTQLEKKSQQNVPSVGPKELQKAPLTDHIRGGFEVLA